MRKLHALLPVMFAGAFALLPAAFAAETNSNIQLRVARLLKQTPLIDGHNDLPEALRGGFGNKWASVDLQQDTRKITPPLHTDIPRLHAGGVGGQFWSVWVSPQIKGADAVQATLDQIDIVRHMAATYPQDLQMAFTADDIVRIHKSGRIASLIGIEGGHQINNSLGTLRQMYQLGVRYMTLTHALNNDWAVSATDTPRHKGLTDFGKSIISEMNRLGMLVDLSHVSEEVMRQTLGITKAPVIYSHSSARALSDHPRNVPDDVLKMVAANGGVVMVNFAVDYVSDARRIWSAARAAESARYNSPPFGGLYIGQPEKAAEALKNWEQQNPAPEVTLAQVADHLDHMRKVAGADHIGIGSDFDGIPTTPTGLGGVQAFPDLLAELARRGWSDADLAKLAGGNLLRVLRQTEKVAAHLQNTTPPSQAVIGK